MMFRGIFLLAASLVGIALLYMTDPDKGSSTNAFLLGLYIKVTAVWFVHVLRKVLFPYLDMRDLMLRARQSSTGSGLAMLAMAIVISALMSLFGAGAHAQVPANAHKYLPMLSEEIDTHWPNAPSRAYFGGLIEHESCITLTHRRCWNPRSELKTSREQGVGFGQITRAYRADGSLRFDALAEMRDRHPSLRGWSWSNVHSRPDFQLRAVVLKVRTDYQALPKTIGPMNRLAFADAAYNGGFAGMQRERRACGMAADCNPRLWFGNVERYCLKSRAPLYGGRSSCDINRHHVKDVLHRRAPKYEGRI
jgi:hypothetical protein